MPAFEVEIETFLEDGEVEQVAIERDDRGGLAEDLLEVLGGDVSPVHLDEPLSLEEHADHAYFSTPVGLDVEVCFHCREFSPVAGLAPRRARNVMFSP